jgi:hypothetical protein
MAQSADQTSVAAAAAVPPLLLLLLVSQVPAGWVTATVAQAVPAQQVGCTQVAAACPCPLHPPLELACSPSTALACRPAGC